MFASNDQRKILLLGPSGAGKSTICNALLSAKVDSHSLKKPACVSASATSCTGHIDIYIGDNTMAITDTIGFDDHRFEPEIIAEELRRLIQAAGIGYAKIILCLRLGRVSEPSRVYLRLLDAIFKDYENNMVLYVSGCEDGTTVDEFLEENKDDLDVGLILAKLKYQQLLHEKKGDGFRNVIVGSMQIHRREEVDRRNCLPLRKQTLDAMKKSINVDTGIIRARPSTERTPLLKALYGILFGPGWETLWQRTWASANRSIDLLVLAMKSSDIISVRYNYGECPVCLDDESKDRWVMTTCLHRFHRDCVKKLPQNSQQQVSCPSCREAIRIKNLRELPIGLSEEESSE